MNPSLRFLATALLVAVPTVAQDQLVVLQGATIWPLGRAPINDGVVGFAGGKIQFVGDANTRIPEGARVVDCRGKVITPGLVDAVSYTHLTLPTIYSV